MAQNGLGWKVKLSIYQSIYILTFASGHDMDHHHKYKSLDTSDLNGNLPQGGSSTF